MTSKQLLLLQMSARAARRAGMPLLVYQFPGVGMTCVWFQ